MQNLNSNIPPTTETLLLKKLGCVDLETVYDDKLWVSQLKIPHTLYKTKPTRTETFQQFLKVSNCEITPCAQINWKENNEDY